MGNRKNGSFQRKNLLPLWKQVFISIMVSIFDATVDERSRPISISSGVSMKTQYPFGHTSDGVAVGHVFGYSPFVQ